MADALLDKSLDTLIAERGKKPAGGGGAKRGGGGRGSKVSGVASAKPRGGKGGRGQGQQQAKAQPAPLAVQSKKIAKRPTGRRGGAAAPIFVQGIPPPWAGMGPPPFVPPGYALVPIGGGPPVVPARGMGAPVALRQPEEPHVRRDPDGDGKWVHDKYDGPLRRSVRMAAPRTMARPVAVSQGKLRVTNLHHNVSQDDLKELFSTAGALESAELVYDASGRSTGEATVVFRNKQDAQAAIDSFNNVALDGQKLVIEHVGHEVVQVLGSGLRVTREAAMGMGPGPMSARPSRGAQGVGRMLQQALPGASTGTASRLPRGMGDSAPSGPARRAGPLVRGQGPGPRLRSGVVSRSTAADEMQE